jgi:thymidylate synthase
VNKKLKKIMNKVDLQYKQLIKKILKEGVNKVDRTGVGTKSIFGHQMRYKMEDGFPLLTLRKIHIKSVINELLWFLGAFDEKYNKFGNCNIRPLLDSNVTFWSDWPYKAYVDSRKYRPELPELTMKEFEAKIMLDDEFALEFGSIGEGSYGHQWLNFGGKIEKKISDGKQNIIITEGVNQIDYLIDELKKNPDSRRLLLNSWKIDEIEKTLLPPCHYGFQLYSKKMCKDDRLYTYSKWLVDNKMPLKPMMEEYNFPTRKLSLMLNQRSCDFYLGYPFNVAEYALLLQAKLN